MSVVKLSAEVTMILDRNATTAIAELADGAEATGASKREPGDVYNESIAMDLALGRAFQKLGRQLVSRGHKSVADAAKAREATTRKSDDLEDIKTLGDFFDALYDLAIADALEGR